MTSASVPVLLVVEDEPVLRMMAVDLGEEAGFEVLEAANSTVAIEILERRLDVCVVFSDIDMPGGLDGMRLAACIRDRWPPIAIILTSGHAVPKPEEMPERSQFFAKPYRPSEVVAAMREMAA